MVIEEVHSVVEFLKKSAGEPNYDDAVLNGPKEVNQALPAGLQEDSNDPESDPLYDEAVEFVLKTRKSSISAIQRQLRVGYNRSARMVEAMEAAGLVGPLEHGKREVLMPAPGGE